jgi:hypothetical protein
MSPAKVQAVYRASSVRPAADHADLWYRVYGCAAPGSAGVFLTTIALLFWRFPEGGLLQISDLRFYIALALSVAYAGLFIYGPTPVARLVGLAYVLVTVALLFWPQSFRSRRDRF